MKRKSRKLKTRIPIPPPQKPRSTKKGKRGYTRQRNTHTLIEEKRVSFFEREFQSAVRNLDIATIEMLQRETLSPEEQAMVESSPQLKFARECAEKCLDERKTVRGV